MTATGERDATLAVGVLGDGGWGTALARVLAGNGHRVRLWGAFPEYVEEMRRTRANRRFLPGVEIPREIELTSDPRAAVQDVDLAFSVVPTPYLRTVLDRFRPVWPSGLPIVSATKGLEIDTLLRPTEILGANLRETGPLAVLSGPSHAEEVARGRATTVAVASEDAPFARRVQGALSSDRFRVYTNEDVAGVELGGALKNVIALAAGMCDGLDSGDNAKAALVTRGLVEIARYGVTRGARRETFSGLAGLGDLLVTAYSRHSRNRSVGERIGRGESLDAILGSTAMVPEGVFTTRALRRAGPPVPMPITKEVYAILFEGKDPRVAVAELMLREPRAESDEGR